jgi:hypothetical protein
MTKLARKTYLTLATLLIGVFFLAIVDIYPSNGSPTIKDVKGQVQQINEGQVEFSPDGIRWRKVLKGHKVSADGYFRASKETARAKVTFLCPHTKEDETYDLQGDLAVAISTDTKCSRPESAGA